jgi:DNA-binding response OmpR family regulator
LRRANLRLRAAPAFTTCSRLDHDFATTAHARDASLANVASHRASAETLRTGELEIRLADGLVLAGGAPMTLSVREFELLVAMARRVGTIVTREALYDSVWGGELRAGDRSVDVYVSKLRAKLERAMPDRRFIHTHPGFGYRFQAHPAREIASVQPREGLDVHAGANGLSHDLHIGTTEG